MWLIDSPIGRWFVGRAERKRSTAGHPSVAVKAGLTSRNLALRKDCTHEEAIADIEEYLCGRASQIDRNDDEVFKVQHHGIV